MWRSTHPCPVPGLSLRPQCPARGPSHLPRWQSCLSAFPSPPPPWPQEESPNTSTLAWQHVPGEFASCSVQAWNALGFLEPCPCQEPPLAVFLRLLSSSCRIAPVCPGTLTLLSLPLGTPPAPLMESFTTSPPPLRIYWEPPGFSSLSMGGPAQHGHS